ncbi:MAG: hypothetical protein AB8B64_21805 [Granulosicoccus sp.]
MVKVITITSSVLVALAAVGYFLTMGSGKPIGTDLSVIGKGKPVLVLAYENYSPAGGNALNSLRKVRSDYDSRLEFAVADLGTPQGRAFADRHQLHDGQALFLNQNGQAVQVTGIPTDEQELRKRIESRLQAVE